MNLASDNGSLTLPMAADFLAVKAELALAEEKMGGRWVKLKSPGTLVDTLV